jgi:hypothetical protein
MKVINRFWRINRWARLCHVTLNKKVISAWIFRCFASLMNIDAGGENF